MPDMKYNTHFFCFALILLAGLPACKKFVDIGEPGSLVVRSKVFNSQEAAHAAVVNMYVQMAYLPGLTNGNASKLLALYADELRPAGTPVQADLPFYNNNLSPANAVVAGSWSSAYNVIYLANAVLEGLAASRAVGDSLRQELQGEARFVRALNYFYLVNLFGRVPLVLSTGYHTTRSLPQATEAAVYGQIVADLEAAITQLPFSRSRPDSLAPGNIRATRWAAMALLGRVHLYQGNWAAARAMAHGVISAGLFTLCHHPADAFGKDSPETLFQLQPVVKGYNSAEGLLFLPVAGLPPYVAPVALLNSIEPGDWRRSAWLGQYMNGPDTLYYPAKYRIRSGITPAKEYSIVLRLAEVYLTRAEAGARLGILQGPAGALQDVNAIRNRAGLGPLPADAGQSQVMAAIEQERRVEFWAEWGHRWLDLRRLPALQHQGLSRAQEVIRSHKPALPGLPEWWPIPAGQLLLNDGWVQNPGYQ